MTDGVTSMGLVLQPQLQQIDVNPESPNMAVSLAK